MLVQVPYQCLVYEVAFPFIIQSSGNTQKYKFVQPPVPSVCYGEGLAMLGKTLALVSVPCWVVCSATDYPWLTFFPT